MANWLPKVLIASLPRDDRPRLLTSFGPVQFNPKVRGEPIIEICMQPLDGIAEKPSLTHDQYCYVGVGVIPHLEVNSIWLNRKRIGIHNGFRSVVRVDFSNHRMLHSVSDSPGKPHYVHVPVLRCEHGDSLPRGAHLVLPEFEFFRFYQAHSTTLTRMWFLQSLEKDFGAFYNPKSLRMETSQDGHYKRVAYISLRKNIRDTDKWIVARLAFSEYARKAAWLTPNSLTKSNLLGNPRCLRALPPFIGETSLTIDWRPPTSGINESIFVNRIIHCAGPFPFDYLKFTRDNDNTSIPGSEPEKEVGYNFSIVRKPIQNDQNGSGYIHFDNSPSSIVGIANYQKPENRFLATHDIPVKYFVPKTHNEFMANQNQKPTQPANSNDLSTAERANNKNETGQAEFALFTPIENNRDERATKETTTPSFRRFAESLDYLQEFIPGSTFIYKAGSPNKRDIVKVGNIILTCVPKQSTPKQKRLKKWCYGKDENDRRKVMIVEISINNAHLYLFEMQHFTEKLSEHYSIFMATNKNPKDSFTPKTFEKVIRHCVINSDWPSKMDLKNLSFRTIKHDNHLAHGPFKTAIKLSTAISQHLNAKGIPITLSTPDMKEIIKIGNEIRTPHHRLLRNNSSHKETQSV